nr:SAM-dependent methyltransferase [Micromonospora sp. DSM 115978]
MSDHSVPENAVLVGVAQTARWTAAARARESARPDRLFDDPHARLLAGDEGQALLRHFHTDRASDQGNPFLPIRTRWFDDFLATAVDRDHCQVVALGAGLDTRAFRLDWPAGAVLYEVDQAAPLRYKTSLLDGRGPRPRCERHLVPVNLTDDWCAALVAAGFDPARPSVWFAEGLLFYLSEELAHDVLTAARRLSAPGSRLAADLIGTGIFRFPYMRNFLRKLDDAGSPWVFGTDRPAGFVAGTGWQVTGVQEPGSPGADFGRWPLEAAPAEFPDLPRSFLVSARVPE